MASVFKPKYSKPIPQGAEIVIFKGKKCACFRQTNGKRMIAPITKSGKRCLIPTRSWYIKYRTAGGIVKSVAGFRDKEATRQRAAELEREVEMEAVGIRDVFKEHRQRPLSKHLDDYERFLHDKGRSKNHVNTTMQRARAVIDGCGFQFFSDISPSKVQGYLGELRAAGTSATSRNHYLTAAKMFINWMIGDRRTKDNPLVGLSKENTSVDRRRVRRPLTENEFAKLLEATAEGSVIQRLSGADRVILYIVASYTGYRRDEIGSVTCSSFDFISSPQTLTVAAGHSKRRRVDTIPLKRDFAQLIRRWIEGRSGLDDDTELFPISGKRTAEMLRKDLKRAGIQYRDKQGRVADFHALRNTFITNLARSGVSPKLAQVLARHSDINLTMNTYTSVELEEQSKAVECLPSIKHFEKGGDQENNANGGRKNTEPEKKLVPELVRTTDAARPGLSSRDMDDEAAATMGAKQKPSQNNDLDIDCHSESSSDVSTRGGTRTLTSLRTLDFESSDTPTAPDTRLR